MRPILLNSVEVPIIEYLPRDYSPITKGTANPDTSEIMNEARRAAEAHRRSRQKLQNMIKPGMSIEEVVEIIESSTRILLKDELNNGIGFPTGVSLNDCAAHHTIHPGEKEVIIKKDDVLKIDFGTHVNGRIMDSAFTVCFDEKYLNLLKASQDATNAGIKALGVDVRVNEIGAVIEEVISSYELEVDGKTIQIKPMSNLNGHSICQFKIHGGITIPNIKNDDLSRIKANNFYAIETFASTGRAYIMDGKGCSHFILNDKARVRIENKNDKKILQTIIKNLKTLPFCPKYVDLMTGMDTKPTINLFSYLGLVDSYPPLMDSEGSLVAQFEHTIWLNENGKEVLTRGDDY